MTKRTRAGGAMWSGGGTGDALGAEVRMGDGISMERAINEIEGYLLWEAEKDRARTRADAFCKDLPWLTDTQRQDVARRYCQDQSEASRSYLERIAARSATLRAEYEGVYRALRRRLITGFLTGTLAVVVLVTVVAVGLTAR
ncbi:hypothetical protein AB0C96_05960 [Streptomyces sp. NPDC048506]|uniref:hypothetical protein n=1 Tax=Streptomyces sp. NPDC048506 TaxID=3155028 RepID=UPI0034365D91